MIRKKFKTHAIGTALAVVCVWSNTEAMAVITYDTRALSGAQAPGAIAGFSYDTFDPPVINAAGHIAFRGTITRVGGGNSVGIWSEGSGQLKLVAQANSTAPGAGDGVVFSGLVDGLGTPILNNAGQTAFTGKIAGPGVISNNNQSIWSEGSGSLTMIARGGQTAPGIQPEATYVNLDDLVFNGAGQTAFLGSLSIDHVDTHESNNSGIWGQSAGTLNLVARKNSAAPNTETGTIFGAAFTPDAFSNLTLNDSGQVAFFGRINSHLGNFSGDSGIWSGPIGSLHNVSRSGDPAPGTPVGVEFGGFSFPVINGAGQTAFWATISGPSIESVLEEGIWSEGSGSLNLVARERENAPGTSGGAVFSGFLYPVINNAGQTAFWARLTGPGVNATTDRGIWSEGSGTLELIAREGSHAPGTDPGTVFTILSPPTLNGSGQTAFSAGLFEPGVDNTNNAGIWATDPNGVLKLIARVGDQFDVDDDPLIEDLRTINHFGWTFGSGGEDGRGTSFNDAGEFTFRLGFTDGSEGVFVATVPEATSFTLACSWVLILLRRRDPRRTTPISRGSQNTCG